LQGTGFPYLCKGKIKAHREAGEFLGKNNVTAIRHPISRRNNYLEIRIEATNRICVNRRQPQGYERPTKQKGHQGREATAAQDITWRVTESK